MDWLQKQGEARLTQEYQSGLLSRRQFLWRLALLTGGVGLSLACGTAPTLTPTPEATTPDSSPTSTSGPAGIESGPVEFPGEGVTLLGYLARPAGSGPHPGVLVVHENRGLLPHFPDVARRLAQAGYTALAVDLLSRQRGTDAVEDPGEIPGMLREVPDEQLVSDASAGISYLQDLPYVMRERVGAIGFCFGGGVVWLLAARNRELAAAVPIYGSRPPLEEVPNIQAPVLGIYAGNDDRINQGVPGLEAELQEHDKEYRFITYPGVDHAFFNDSGGNYAPDAAAEAWQETLAWFNQHLRE